MSLVDQILGRGAVADFRVWKNKITSGITLVMATISWYVLEIMETRLVPFLCSILLLLMLLLFIWVKFGQILLIRRPPTPEEIKKRGSPIRALFPKIERLFLMLYEIAYGRNMKTSLWAIFYLAIIYTIGSFINLITMLYICLVCSMTIPVLYRQFQETVDRFIWEVSEVKYKTLEIFRSRATKKKNVKPQMPMPMPMPTSQFTTNRSSTSTANGPSTSTVNGPSTSTANGTPTSTTNEPFTSTTNEPFTSTANEPSTTNEPSMANGPSTTTDNGPSTSTANGPSRCAHLVRRFHLFRRSAR